MGYSRPKPMRSQLTRKMVCPSVTPLHSQLILLSALAILASLTGKKAKKEIRDEDEDEDDGSIVADDDDDQDDDNAPHIVHKSIKEVTDPTPIGLQLYWIYHTTDDVWFILKDWTDLEQLCKVEEYGVRVYWSLKKPDDNLLLHDLKLDLHGAHQMVHDLKGEYWIQAPMQLIPLPALVERTTTRGYKILKVKVFKGAHAHNTLF
jgi:hypothetical protein